MDRDARWERTDLALAAHRRRRADGAVERASRRVQASYDAGLTDEFIRADRARRPARVSTPGGTRRSSSTSDPIARGSCRERLGDGETDLTTMTRYREDLDFPVAFPEQTVAMVLAEVLAEHGVRQLHAAETEKYAHVTYFFNGGREERVRRRDTRLLVPSPRDVPSYDHKPEMSAYELADRFVDELGEGLRLRGRQLRQPRHGRATRASSRRPCEAVETADACLGPGRRRDARAGGVCLITADHGNAEQLLQDDGGSPHTAHTTNPVPLIVTRGRSHAEDRRALAISRRPFSPCSASASPYKWAGPKVSSVDNP